MLLFLSFYTATDYLATFPLPFFDIFFGKTFIFDFNCLTDKQAFNMKPLHFAFFVIKTNKIILFL